MPIALHASPRQETHLAHQAAGLHLIGDLHGCRCDTRLMLDMDHLEAFCKASVVSAGLTAVGSLFHRFADGGGVTGVVVLAESHLSIHTWPETGYVALDVYVCNYSGDNRTKAQQLFDSLQAAFNPGSAHWQCVDRGNPRGVQSALIAPGRTAGTDIDVVPAPGTRLSVASR